MGVLGGRLLSCSKKRNDPRYKPVAFPKQHLCRTRLASRLPVLRPSPSGSGLNGSAYVSDESWQNPLPPIKAGVFLRSILIMDCSVGKRQFLFVSPQMAICLLSHGRFRQHWRKPWLWVRDFGPRQLGSL